MKTSLFLIAVISLHTGICSGGIIQVRYRGAITRVGQNVPEQFAIGESVWGTYAFTDNSAGAFAYGGGSQYAAVRQFSVQTAGGFRGNINAGTVTVDNNDRFEDRYSVSSRAPDLLDPQPSVNPDDSWGPDGYDLENPGATPELIQYKSRIDFASLLAASQDSVARGFPPTSGVFLEYPQFYLELHLWGTSTLWPRRTGLFDSEDLNDTPPAQETATRLGGVLNFETSSAYDAESQVWFELAEFAVVPEPSYGLTSSGFAFMLIQLAMRRRSLRPVVGFN